MVIKSRIELSELESAEEIEKFLKYLSDYNQYKAEAKNGTVILTANYHRVAQ